GRSALQRLVHVRALDVDDHHVGRLPLTPDLDPVESELGGSVVVRALALALEKVLHELFSLLFGPWLNRVGERDRTSHSVAPCESRGVPRGGGSDDQSIPHLEPVPGAARAWRETSGRAE